MKLTIEFAGICTHFRNGVAAGVPHRVVLPDASKLTSGLLTIEESPVLQRTPVAYYLLPHYAQLQVNGVNADIPPVVMNGDVLSGIRLQVVNATDKEMTYLPAPDKKSTPALTDYVPGYTFSTEVVLSGRAMLYFDLYGGTMTATVGAKGAMRSVVTLTTEGRPEVLVTPLARDHRPGRSYQWLPGQGGDTRLTVSNLELDVAGESSDEGAFDFMLHYLTARGGIPQSILKQTPGMPKVLTSATPRAITPDVPGRGRKLTPDFESTPSCSDSQYP